MADDNTLRSYRSNDPYRHRGRADEAQDTAVSGDPLAELARLIGHPDPYADSPHTHAQGSGARAPQQGQHEASDWRRYVERPHYEGHDEPAYGADPRQAATEPYHDPYRMPSPQHDDYANPYADGRHQQSYADEPIYAAAPHHGGHAEDPHYGVHAPVDEGYDDPPRRSRSGSSLLTAVVLIGCAMLGTAGAYGYRTYATSSGNKPAPVITADSSPSKIVPNTEQKSARSQDRVTQGNDERLVSREEQPVALQPPGNSSVPRVVFPSPVTTGSTPPASEAADAQTANAQAAGGAGEAPKRVRTVTIRPDGGDFSGRPSGDATARATPPAAKAAPPAARAPRDQPLSLDPASPAQATEPARQPQQQQQKAAPAPRVAALPPSSGNGGYLVQVSSQRSEADAQASYRGLQAKYSQLKSRQPIIRRADLGTKGVYYRAMVGPFESSDDASQFCSGLKQAGGQCLIVRN